MVSGQTVQIIGIALMLSTTEKSFSSYDIIREMDKNIKENELNEILKILREEKWIGQSDDPYNNWKAGEKIDLYQKDSIHHYLDENIVRFLPDEEWTVD